MGACTLAMSQVVRSQPACRLRQFTDPSSPQASSVLAETRTTPPDTPTMMTEERREMVRAAIRSASKKGARMALSEEEVERVITACEPAEYSAGQVVVTQSAPWPYFCVILNGAVQVSRIGKGVLGRLTTADWFGDMRSPNALATLNTLSKTLLVKISAVKLAAAAQSPAKRRKTEGSPF